jgi:hypothetical protein
MIDFDDCHRRYWRDHRKNPDAAIPVRGGDIIERDGRRYAVLRDADGKLVAAYEIVERLYTVRDAALIESFAPEPEPPREVAYGPRRRR